HHRLVVGAAGLQTGAALDRPVDVVAGDRGLLRLLDGVIQGRVTRRVSPAGTGSDFDVLDQPGEELTALGVDGGLLVLRGRPFGVPRHIRTSRWLLLRSPVMPGDEIDKGAVNSQVTAQLWRERRRATCLLTHSVNLTCPSCDDQRPRSAPARVRIGTMECHWLSVMTYRECPRAGGAMEQAGAIDWPQLRHASQTRLSAVSHS